MPTIVQCPSCEKKLRVADELLGKTVRCPGCKTAFTAEGEDEPIEAELVEEAPRRPRRPVAAADDEEDEPRPRRPQEVEDEEKDEPRPRRRPRRINPRREAESAVAGPAIALMVIAGLGALVDVWALVNILLGLSVAPAGVDPGVFKVARAIALVLMVVWTIIVLLGGLKMKSLSSYGAAMTGCIFAMLPCNIVCLGGLPIGIWALVVLNRPDVKRAFG
jgi:predicted Zn finger-like uncharacterized protein